MGVRRFLFAAALITNFSMTVQAEDVLLEPVYFTDSLGCLDVLAEFSWFCVIYEGPMWGRLYFEAIGKSTYWELTEGIPTPAYRHDLDGDGKDDLIVAIKYGFCDRGGPTSCSHGFLFGGMPPRDGAPLSLFSAAGRPTLTKRNGVSGIIFEGNPDWFHPIDELRDTALTGHTTNMELP